MPGLLGNDRQLDPAILGAALFRVIGGDRVIGTGALGDDPIGRYAGLDKRILDGGSAFQRSLLVLGRLPDVIGIGCRSSASPCRRPSISSPGW